jgi:hypothetical protein
MKCNFCTKEVGKKIAIAVNNSCICIDCILQFMEIIGEKLVVEIKEFEEDSE